MTYVMISLDLERGVSEEKRKAFNDYLASKNVTKIPKVTTTWSAYYPNATDAQALEYSKNHIAAAARYAAISYYEAVMHAGPAKPVSFKD